METKRKTNKKLIDFSDRQLEMIDLISEHTGFTKTADIVRIGIQELYDKYYKSYKTGQSSRTLGNQSEETLVKNAMIKSKAKILTEQAEEEMRLQPKIDICKNVLHGEIETNSNGTKICRFKQYNAFFPEKDNEQVVPLSQVGAYLAETSLFIPAKEVVFKNRKDIKDKFDENI